jgi:hypothetical protein
MEERVVFGHGEGGDDDIYRVEVEVVVLRRAEDVECGWWGTM